MKIIKYVLFTVLLLILWVTEPLWFKKSYDTPNASSTDIFITEQDKERKQLLKAESAKLKAIEDKFGVKPTTAYGTRVPQELYDYWAKTLKFPDSLEEERCEPIRASSRGWEIVCRYRVKNNSGHLGLRQNTYIINNGVVSR